MKGLGDNPTRKYTGGRKITLPLYDQNRYISDQHARTCDPNGDVSISGFVQQMCHQRGGWVAQSVN